MHTTPLRFLIATVILLLAVPLHAQQPSTGRKPKVVAPPEVPALTISPLPPAAPLSAGSASSAASVAAASSSAALSARTTRVSMPQRPYTPGMPMMPGINSSSQVEVLPFSCEITLTITDDKAQGAAPAEIGIVTSSSRFTSTSSADSVFFSGLLTQEDGGTLLLAYNLDWAPPAQPLPPPPGAGQQPVQTVQRQSNTSETVVRLTPGEEVTLLRVGSQTARLVLKKL